MKIAITVWEDKISPVFDASCKLSVFEIQNRKIVSQKNQQINQLCKWELIESLTDMGVSVLICGAISKLFSDTIENKGITLVPFISGNVEKIVNEYARLSQIRKCHYMPGCECHCKSNRHRKFRAPNN